MAWLLPSRTVAGVLGRRLPPHLLVVLAWAGLIGLAHLLGSYIVRRDPTVKLNAPPLFGRFETELGVGLVIAILVAVVVVAVGTRIAARASWRRLVLATVAAVGVWAVSVAAISGVDAITEPLLNRGDYLRAVPQVGEPGAFLGGFVADIAGYPVHVQGHPPGMVLLLWLLDSLGLGGATWAAAVVIGVGASSAAAVLIAMREMGGERLARRSAPFIALSPLVIWLATSADALFAAIGAWGVCLAVLACRSTGLRSHMSAVGSGLLLGALSFLTYAAVLVTAIAAVIVAFHRRFRVAALIAGALAAVVGAFVLGGFWWLDGLFATIERYGAGVASNRPYLYFLVANLAALAVAIGPATAAGLARISWSPAWLLPIAAVMTVGLANLSGLSKGEVERIWLPFAVWLMPAASLVSGNTRRWLSIQAAWTLMVQVIVKTPW